MRNRPILPPGMLCPLQHLPDLLLQSWFSHECFILIKCFPDLNISIKYTFLYMNSLLSSPFPLQILLIFQDSTQIPPPLLELSCAPRPDLLFPFSQTLVLSISIIFVFHYICSTIMHPSYPGLIDHSPNIHYLFSVCSCSLKRLLSSSLIWNDPVSSF